MTRRTKTGLPRAEFPSGAIDQEKTGELRAAEVVTALNAGDEKKAIAVAKTKMVKDALEKKGFSDDAAKNVVAEILMDPEQKAADRLAAADKVFKVMGTYAPEKSISLNLNSTAKGEDPEIRKLREEYEAKLREQMEK